MNEPLRDPTEDELSAMAYVDGELDRAARARFEERLGREPALAREVAAQQRLAVLARIATPPEPQDIIWKELALEPLHRRGQQLSLWLLGLGMLCLAVAVVAALCVSDLALLPKFACLSVLGGLALAFLITVRARLRTLPHDPYRDVER